MISVLHQSLSQHAASSPDKVAFRCREQEITYRNLYQHSNILANKLLEFGISPMARVGIYMGKCIELPVATYGILSAGACYVPIDPSAPLARVEYILKDCGIDILITQASKLRQLKKLLAQDQTCLTHIIGIPEGEFEGIQSITWETLNDGDSSFPEITVCEHDLAYIMYTSGSTGTPKGLMHTHASGLSYARHSAQLYQVEAEDVLGNHAPLHFDISTFEFLTGPLVGATTVLIPEEEMMFPGSLAALIARERLTFWYSVPLALIQMLISADLKSLDLSSLRWVLFGGEPFPPKYLQELMSLIPSARFCNVYGPAEVNQCTYYHLPRRLLDIEQAVPLGGLWAGARGMIVDPEDEVVKRGEVGELLISSASMMQGYWGRAELNKQAFYDEEPLPGFQRRYYRTGDLVREDAGNILHFQGRRDRQVKIRGYRLELDEVEAVFTSQQDVKEAVALVLSAIEKESQLIVFVMPHDQASFDPQVAYLAARGKLPHYGVPEKIEVLSTFPRTTSGKVDRLALSKQYEQDYVR